MNPENLIKGRIAETLVSEMLQEAGYYVYRFGYEGILQSLTQRGLPKMKEDDVEAEKVRAMPDFIVMNKQGDVSFVEVKFRSAENLNEEMRELILKTAKYWPEARMLFVRPQNPYFLIVRAQDFVKKERLYPLEKERFLVVREKIVKKYEKLAQRYFAYVRPQA
jgi:hypothetical protein